MDRFAVAIGEGQPLAGEIREALLDPFLEATHTALAEMAGTEVAVRAAFQMTRPRALGDLAAVLRVQFANDGSFVLSFPQKTAEELADRILAGVSQEVDENLVRDCVGEIANVIAGQAKALLAGGPYHLTFSVPRIVVEAQDCLPQPDQDCLAAVLSSDLGDFALQLFLKR